MLISLIYLFWFATIVAGLVAGVRLLITGLAAEYSGLMAWASVTSVGSLLLFFFKRNPEPYLWVSASVYLLQTVSVFYLVRTLFLSHLRAYPGIGVFAQKLLSGLVGFSALISVFAIHQDWLSAVAPRDWTFTLVRIVDTGFAAFLFSAGVFFGRYRVPTKRNVLRIEAGATVYFAIQALAFLAIMAIGTPAKMPASVLLEGADFVLFAYFSVALNQAGERLPLAAPNPARQARVEALNIEALRFARQVKAVLRNNS